MSLQRASPANAKSKISKTRRLSVGCDTRDGGQDASEEDKLVVVDPPAAAVDASPGCFNGVNLNGKVARSPSKPVAPSRLGLQHTHKSHAHKAATAMSSILCTRHFLMRKLSK